MGRVAAGRASGMKTLLQKPMNMADTDLDPAMGVRLKRRARTPPYSCEKWTTTPVSRADTADEDSSEKKAERQRRERKDHQDCHIECGKHDRQRTRGRGFYGAEEDQHHVRPRDKVEGQQGEKAGKWL